MESPRERTKSRVIQEEKHAWKGICRGGEEGNYHEWGSEREAEWTEEDRTEKGREPRVLYYEREGMRDESRGEVLGR